MEIKLIPKNKYFNGKEYIMSNTVFDLYNFKEIVIKGSVKDKSYNVHSLLSGYISDKYRFFISADISASIKKGKNIYYNKSLIWLFFVINNKRYDFRIVQDINSKYNIFNLKRFILNIKYINHSIRIKLNNKDMIISSFENENKNIWFDKYPYGLKLMIGARKFNKKIINFHTGTIESVMLK